MSKRKTSIEQRLSAEHRQLLNEKLLAKNATDKDLWKWVNSLDDSYNISSSAFGRYAQAFHKTEENFNTLSDEERRLVLLFRNINQQKKEKLVAELFFEDRDDKKNQ